MGEDGESRAAEVFDLETVVRFAELALHALGRAREEIDALNVYPVPDGDTGTNMFLTFEAARDALREALPATPPDLGPQDDADERSVVPVEAEVLPRAMAAFARGALLGARGNSGVIFSQLVGALCVRVIEAGPGGATGPGARLRHDPGHRGQLRGRRRAGGGHHPLGGPRRLGGRRGRGPIVRGVAAAR